MNKLTNKQATFVREYLIDLNATQAAIRAGYSAKSAYAIGDENLKKPEIAEAVQAAMDKRAQRVEVSADYVLQTIVETVERCKQAEPVMVKGAGGELVESGEYKFDSGAVLKGCELLGKHLKLFTERHEISADVKVTRSLADFYDEQEPPAT